jgi:DNA-binding CsgD family transcriptional regulator
MVGRSWPLAQLEAALADPARVPVVLRGPAGIGKSRLAEEAVDRGAPDAWRARASAPFRHSPLAPFALVAPHTITGSSERKELIRSAIAAIEAAPPSAIWVDDGHHLDPESAAVVFHLARHRVVTVVITVRAGEALPPAIEAVLDHDATVLDLSPLDPDEVGDLARWVLGGDLAAPSRRRLVERSGGNPLLVRELLRAAGRDGTLREHGGVWHLDAASPPATLEDLVTDHALGVGPTALELFGHLAVADRIEDDILAQLSSAAGLEELAAADLVRADGDGALLARHRLYAEVVLARLDAAGRERIALGLAEAIERARGPERQPDDEVRAVRWRLEARAAVDPERAQAVAWTALAVFDLDLTEAAARSAVEGGLAQAELPLATALAYSGRHAEAEPHFDRAVAAAQGEWAVAFTRLAGTLNRAYHAGWGTWVVDAHRAAAAEATEPDILLLLQSEETSALAFAGCLDEAVALGAPQVLDADVEVLAALPFVPGYAAAATAEGRTSEVIEALARLERAIQDAPTRAHAWLYAFRAQAEAVHGQLAEVERAMAAFDELAYLAMVEDVAAVLSSEMRGLLCLWRGDAAGAVRWLGEAVALSEVPESRFRRVIPWAHLAQARALAGDAAGAAAAAREAEEAGRLFPLGAGYVGSAIAWARRAAGDATGAARQAVEAAEDAERAGLATAALWTSIEALRFDPTPTTAAATLRRAEVADGRWAGAFAAHAAAVVQRSPDLLHDAADRYAEIGARRHEHEVLRLAAGWYRADGRRDRAHRTGRRAADAANACCGIGLIEVTADDDPAIASLTPRERQVAGLAAAGRSNAEVAERLGLSIRTTEGHLAKAMAKLDVARRSELAGRLGVAPDDA